MIKLVHIGQISIPKVASQMTRKALMRREIIQRQISRGLVEDINEVPEVRQELAHRLRQELKLKSDYSEVSFLCFGDVPEHDDDWGKVKSKAGHWVQPGFLHIVLKGSGYIRSGQKSIHVKRGDVFLHNPKAQHSFEKTSKDFCMTFCITVPLTRAFNEMTKTN